MPGELQLALLGKPHAYWNGVPVDKFVFSKSMALLAYLATTGRPHTARRWLDCCGATCRT